METVDYSVFLEAKIDGCIENKDIDEFERCSQLNQYKTIVNKYLSTHLLPADENVRIKEQIERIDNYLLKK